MSVPAIVEIGRLNGGISICCVVTVGMKGSIVESSHKHRNVLDHNFVLSGL